MNRTYRKIPFFILSFLLGFFLNQYAQAEGFDSTCYVTRYPWVKSHYQGYGYSPLKHWKKIGSKIGLIPDCSNMSSNTIQEFNASCYMERYPGVVNVLGKKNIFEGYDHWLKVGRKNYLNPSCNSWETNNRVSASLRAKYLFDEDCYSARYPKSVIWSKKYKRKVIEHWVNIGYGKSYIPGCLNMDPHQLENYLTHKKIDPTRTNEVSITGKDSDPIALSIFPRQSGTAISSLRFNSKEFINTWDHGRELQSAFQGDGYGECYNPTEAGSQADGLFSEKSSSQVLGIEKLSQNILSASSAYAFWLSNKERTGACLKGLSPLAPLPKLSGLIANKRVTIGEFGDSKIIKFELEFNPNQIFNFGTVIELLTGYLNAEFDQVGYVDSSNLSFNQFDPSEYKSLVGMGFPQGSFTLNYRQTHREDPIVFSNLSGSHAMGIYFPLSQRSPFSSFDGYNIYKFNLSDGTNLDHINRNATVKWSLAVRETPELSLLKQSAPRSFVVYITVGTKAQAINSLMTAMQSAN